jgi:hypothetical protein
MVDEKASPPRPWLTTLALFACVALELVIASSPFDAPARVAALLGLATIAVAISLRQALGVGPGSLVPRAIVYLPMLFSVIVIVVLLLDAHFRRVMGVR